MEFGSSSMCYFFFESYSTASNMCSCQSILRMKLGTCWFLFVLILYVPVNKFSVMSGQFFLGWTSTKQRKNCLAKGHNTVSPLAGNLLIRSKWSASWGRDLEEAQIVYHLSSQIETNSISYCISLKIVCINIRSVKQISERKFVNIFLPIIFSICF